MKRLFAIKEVSTNEVVEGLDFEEKKLAKDERKKLNGKGDDGKENLRYVITPGPDHKDYVPERERKERELRQHETASRNISIRKRHKEPMEIN